MDINYRFEMHDKREHPIIKSFKSKLSKENTNYFENIIGLITKTIPSDTISIDIRDNPNKIVTTNTDRNYIENLALDFFKMMKSQGLSKKELEKILNETEPFASDSVLIKELLQKENII